MEALTGRGLCPFPRRGHLKRLTRRSEQSQGGRVWAAEAQADTVGKRGGGVLGVPVRSRGVGSPAGDTRRLFLVLRACLLGCSSMGRADSRTAD